ncbi:hypothetical protein [Maribacter sp. R86514]|uniref:hypothetical protein n=1 Tax=Maribacter sp. R86514 TaxID=3093854 RepID=UPI0037C8FA2B
MTNLDAFKLNPHTIYHNSQSRLTCALNLLLFAKKQFKDSYIIQNLDKLKIICEESSLKKPPTEKIISGFINNGLIDTIKISICFENYSKAILIARGYLIHNIDSNKFKTEAKKQKKNPFLIEEYPGELYNDSKIKTEIDTIRLKYYGLKDTTEHYSVILNNQEYLNIIKLEPKLVEILIELNKARNSLHLQYSLSFNLKSTSYQEFKTLSDFVDTKLNENIKRLNDYLFGEGNTKKPDFKIATTPNIG